MDIFLTINVDTGNGEKPIDVWYDSVTDNLMKMAKLANLYTVIYEPKFKKARSQIAPLKAGLEQLQMKDGYDSYKKLESRHLWGSYDALLLFTKKYLKACEDNPKCDVNVFSE